MKIILPEFATKAEMFDYLVLNKKDLINLKKSAIKEGDSFGLSKFEESVIKSLNATHNIDSDSEIKRTIIGNTYNWMDSHDDVHLDGLFSESIKQRTTKGINHFHDHIPQVGARVGIPQKVYEAPILWTDLGINKVGETQALFMDSLIKRGLNPSVFEQYKDEEVNQHSVGMQYNILLLAINDPERKEEFSNWNKYINQIGNRAKADDKGYFWAVKEAKLIEISCVVAGSNELTGTLPNKNIDPSKDSQDKIDPPLEQSKSYYDYFLN